MSIADLLILKEAVHSTALEHEDGCSCLTCRAAGGDTGAWSKIVAIRFGTELEIADLAVIDEDREP